MCVCSSNFLCNSAGSAIQCPHASLERIDWLFPIHRLVLTSYHPFIDGLRPRIHVDIDEVLAEIVNDCSFEDAVPRSTFRPRSVTSSHVPVPCPRAPPDRHRSNDLSMRRDAASRHAKSMRSGEQQQRGVASCPQGGSIGGSSSSGSGAWRRRPSVT